MSDCVWHSFSSYLTNNLLQISQKQQGTPELNP